MEKKKHVIITGGAKGIGAACVQVFDKASYNISILDVDEEKGQKIANDLGDSCLFIHCDVSKSNQVDQSIEKAIEHFGETDVLVNNVGINYYSTITETTDEMWDRVMDINLKSHFMCSRACIPSMQENGKGVIIDVSSVQAFMTQKSVAAYTASKAALLGLTRSIAVDYSPEIRSVAICPGSIDTPMLRNAVEESPNPEEVFKECEDMHLLKRVGKPEEIAELIGFVASDKAAFLTGRAIRIDGGLGIEIAGSRRD